MVKIFPPAIRDIANKLITLILQNKLLVGYLLFYFIVISLVSVNRFWQFEVYYFDHGIFDQSLWSVAHFKPPLIDHFDPRPLNQLGDHFTPSLYLLTPIYWLTSNYEALFVVQNLFVVLAAGVMYKLSLKLTKSKLMSFALLVAFTLFIGLQNGLIAGFHTELPALFTLSLTFYFLVTEKWRYFWLFLLFTLGFKEVFVSIAFGIGLYLFLTKRYKQGILVGVVSLIYFLIATRLIIPYFAGGQAYIYETNIPNSITALIGQFLEPLKVKTMAVSFVTFGGLPLAALAAIPLIFQDFLIRFVLSAPGSANDLGLHYNIMLSLLLYFAAIVGVQHLNKFTWYKKKLLPIHAVLIIFIALAFHYKLRGPLGLAYNTTFYANTANHQFLRDFIAAIPQNGLVMTQNNLAPQLTHSHEVMLLRDTYWDFMPQTVALDIRAGQSANAHWPIDVDTLTRRLNNDPNYELQQITEEQVLYVQQNTLDMAYYERFKKKN